MSIISKESFEKLTRDEKKKLRQIYKDMKEEPSLVYAHEYAEKCEWLEDYFGEENLQFSIKTWEDVMDNLNEIEKDDIQSYIGEICCGPSMNHGSNLICRKMIATYEIAKLIEIGYGGIISKEEWENEDIRKFSIVRFKENLSYGEGRSAYEFVSFHTPEQREEFMSYESNRKLLEQYYMM